MTDFICDVKYGLPDQTRVAWRKVCEGLDYYGDAEGLNYCVLHYPSSLKALSAFAPDNQFERAVKDKCQNEDFNFSGVVFPSEFRDFGSTQFDSDVSFRDAVFHDAPYFTKSTFVKAADFSSAEFHSGADFSEANFKSIATFQGARFFSGVGGFVSTIFEREANFRGADFRKGAHFYNTRFEKKADFTKATFSPGPGHWRNQGAIFWGTTFVGLVTFSETTFEQETNFKASTFNAGARFHGRGPHKRLFDFRAGVSFDGAWIDKPEQFFFRTSQLRPAWFVSLDGVQKMNFADVEWYGVTSGVDEHKLKDEIEAVKHQHKPTRYRLLADTCRKLSINAEEKRDYSSAGEFHYWEMDASRKGNWSFFKTLGPKALLEKAAWRNIWKNFGIITTVYWFLSGYGERPRRAFFVLLGMCAMFAALYMHLGPSEMQTLGQAVVYSLGAIARLNPEPRPDEPGLFQFLVIVEGLLGPLQIALLALAIRRKVMR